VSGGARSQLQLDQRLPGSVAGAPPDHPPQDA
jgi:hypothetical protein